MIFHTIIMASVRPSVSPSVCLSVSQSAPYDVGFNHFATKLHILCEILKYTIFKYTFLASHAVFCWTAMLLIATCCLRLWACWSVTNVWTFFVVFGVFDIAYSLLFSERDYVTFATCYGSSVCRLSSVTLVHPTQPVELFGNFFHRTIYSPGTLLLWCQKSLVGTPLSP